MRGLSSSVALALPSLLEQPELVTAIGRGRRGKLAVEVRIGVGPLRRGVPLRVVGFGGCVADALKRDVVTIVRPPDSLLIFCSAAKAGVPIDESAVISIAALAGALRIAGVTAPITLDLAEAGQEVPADLEIQLPMALFSWLKKAALRSGNAADPRFYAIEHAAPSMFADLASEDRLPLRVTIGGATEGRFWAVRMLVRMAALAQHLPVAPAIGLMMKAVKVPWYSPTNLEPLLQEVLNSRVDALAALEWAARPGEGNVALVRESRRTQQLLSDDRVLELAAATADASEAARFIRAQGFEVGDRLAQLLVTS